VRSSRRIPLAVGALPWVQVWALELQTALESAVAADPDLLQLARRAFQAFVRAYATHATHLKHIFQVREKGGG
jgi:hypothetical protein